MSVILLPKCFNLRFAAMRMAFSYHCMYFTSLGIFTTIGVQAVQMVALTTVVTLVGWKRLNSKNGFKAFF